MTRRTAQDSIWNTAKPADKVSRAGRSRFQALCAWMRPQSGMHRAECARAFACLRGHIPGGAPVLRCGTRPESPGPSKESKYYWVVPGCGARVVTGRWNVEQGPRSGDVTVQPANSVSLTGLTRVSAVRSPEGPLFRAPTRLAGASAASAERERAGGAGSAGLGRWMRPGVGRISMPS